MEERGRGSERWSGAITNLTEMASNLESLQKLLLKKAVFVDDETFAKASVSAEQARTIKVLEQRVETLERELDAAITAAAHARSEKRQAEAAQKAAELRAQERYLGYTWKSCVQSKKKSQSVIKTSNF